MQPQWPVSLELACWYCGYPMTLAIQAMSCCALIFTAYQAIECGWRLAILVVDQPMTPGQLQLQLSAIPLFQFRRQRQTVTPIPPSPQAPTVLDFSNRRPG